MNKLLILDVIYVMNGKPLEDLLKDWRYMYRMSLKLYFATWKLFSEILINESTCVYLVRKQIDTINEMEYD